MTPDEEMAEWVETCRGCLSKATLVPIREDIRTKFFESTSIMVSKDDGLPSYLCLDCLDTLNYANQFKKECLRIDAGLRKKLITLRAKQKAAKCQLIPLKGNNHAKNSVLDEINKKLLNSDRTTIKTEKNDIVEIKNEDEDCYYVVIINENNKGEKTMQAVKMENSEDGEFKLPAIKEELLDCEDEEEEGQYMGPDEPSLLLPESPEKDESHEGNTDQPPEEGSGIELREIPVGDMETDQQEQIVDDGRLNLIQVLSENGEAAEGNLIQYTEDGVSLVGEVITGDLAISEDGMAYAQQEVVLGDAQGEYEIVCNGTELNDDDETIAVMQQLDGSFLCDCGESFMDFYDYEAHNQTHNVFCCPVCNRGFESKEIVQGHMLLHSKTDPMLPCPFCYQLIKRNMITTHIKINHNQARPCCTICDKSFANDHNLKRHMVIHSGEKKYECDVCGKRFNQKVSMQNHRMLHINTLKCECCLRIFNTEEDMLAHQEEGCEPPSPSDERNVEKPFTCVTCGKQYLTMASLRSHIEYLHNNPPVELLCSECGEVLPSRKAMYSHAYSHRQAKVKNLKRFACSTCGKGCSSHAMLLMHERVHTNERPFKCAKCTLAFKTKTHLTTHQLTHTQEKRFGCSVCMKFFALKGNLVVHLRTHTGERPYVCSICNQAFIDSKYLKKHKQRRHDIANIPWNRYY